MALYKEIKQPDGVTTSYHRILYLTMTTNRQNSIAVLSYVDNESRARENGTEVVVSPYQKAVTYEFDYMPDLTVEAAYNLIKSLPLFEGAEDV